MLRIFTMLEEKQTSNDFEKILLIGGYIYDNENCKEYKMKLKKKQKQGEKMQDKEYQKEWVQNKTEKVEEARREDSRQRSSITKNSKWNWRWNRSKKRRCKTKSITTSTKWNWRWNRTHYFLFVFNKVLDTKFAITRCHFWRLGYSSYLIVDVAWLLTNTNLVERQQMSLVDGCS